VTARALFLEYYQNLDKQVQRIRQRAPVETAWESSYGEHKLMRRALITVAGAVADPTDTYYADILLNEWISPEHPEMTSLAARQLLDYYSRCTRPVARWIASHLAILCKEHGVRLANVDRVQTAIRHLSCVLTQ
jgi:hypothetical protein